MKKKIKIGILGLGNVGQGVINLINNSRVESTLLSEESNNFSIHSACVRNLTKKRQCDLTGIKLTDNWLEVVENPEIDIIIEVIGGVDTAFKVTQKALEMGKVVISANKALLCEKGEQLFKLDNQSKGYILFEAACAGALPIIRILRGSIVSERIKSLVGILNGTSNFILSTMSEAKLDFKSSLKKAQELGYAEADSTLDIEGLDAAHKLVLLSKLAFTQNSDEVYYQGISKIQIDDINYAEQLGYVIKHLAIANVNQDGELNLRVHPALVHKKELISKVSGAMNTVSFKAHFSGEHLYYGSGAGGNETASAILADLAESLRYLGTSIKPYRSSLNFKNPISIKPISEIKEIYSRYYLRLQVVDETGILAKITKNLNNKGISIDVIHQDEAIISNGEKIKDIILITHRTQQSEINLCLEYFSKLKSVINTPILFRVYN